MVQKAEPAPDPTPDEIRDRLRLQSPALAAALYEVVRGQLQVEEVRHTRLDAKANSVLAAAGISMAVAASVGAVLGSNNAGVLSAALLWLFLGTGVVGVVVVGIAVESLLVSKRFATLDDRAIFSEFMLKRGDEPPGCDDLAERSERNAFGLGLYQQYLVSHMVDIYRRNSAALDRKATLVHAAQRGFVLFLGLVLVSEAWLFSTLAASHAG